MSWIGALLRTALMAGLAYKFSRGAGYWGPPVRFAAPSELTRVILFAG
jgi:predicted MPP superfamily phosphohydrolase